MKRLNKFLKYFVVLHTIQLLFELLPNLKICNKWRGRFMRPFFKSCGKNFQIAKGVTINVIWNMEVGDDVYIAHQCWINAAGGLKIESGAILSPRVVVATTKHQYIDGRVSNTLSELAPIIIGEGVWIASNTVVAKGTTIGAGSIIGACSSVTKNIEPYVFAAGAPAKALRTLYDEQEQVS